MMRRLLVVHAAELPNTMPGVINTALRGPLPRLLHPHPDSLRKGDNAGEMITGHAHVLELPVLKKVRVPHNQAYDLLQNRAFLFKAEEPIEDRIVGMLEIAFYRVRRAWKKDGWICVLAGMQNVFPSEPLERNQLRWVIREQLTQGDHHGALYVAIYPPLPKQDAIPPDVGLQDGHPYAFENIEDGVPRPFRSHVLRHSSIVEKGESIVRIQFPKLPDLQSKGKR